MASNFEKSKKFNWIWAYSLIGTLAIIASLYFANISYGIENFSNYVSLPVYSIIPGTLVLLSIWAISKSDTIVELPKKSLVFLTLSFASWFTAEQMWNLFEHVLDIDPYPSAADFFYLIAPIFMFVSLIIFLKSNENKISKTKILFSSLISLVILIPSLIATFEVGIEDEPFEILIALCYPIVDAILLVPVIITISFLISSKKKFFWLMILTGAIIMLSADTIFLFLVIEDAYVDGHPVDILWISSYTIWSFMMFYLIRESNQNDGKKNSNTFSRYGSKKLERYGVFIALFAINVTVILFLIGSSVFIEPSPDDHILQFFFWFLIMMVIMFSGIVLLLNSKLNKTLQNRTAQLEKTTDELIKSERFSAIGELASRISHDIRNPLSNLNMSIELLKNSPPETKLDDELVNEKLELASKNIERISHQVNDVLGYVRNRQMKKENFNLLTCLREAIESIQVPENIKIKHPKSGKNIIADSFQIQIVLNNLITNGIQAIGKNQGEIAVNFFEKDDSIIIEVENSGPPIPEGILPHIFESLITTKQIGTGLGLVSCKTIVENHNGSITVRNNPTVFTITLPKKPD